ncbi:hypothetical protein OROGR_011266 [Orobanche gracilis]
MQKTMHKYLEDLKYEGEFFAKKIENLENSHRKLLGQNLGSCSMEELHEIDTQLEKSLKNIRSRKAQLFKEEIEKLKAKEKFLLEENETLYEKIGLKQRRDVGEQKETGSCSQSTQNSEVVTELFIGLPTTRNGTSYL